MSTKEEQIDPLLPTEKDGLHSVGGGDTTVYIQVGEEFMKHFKDLVNLQPNETVLDIGSGTGRIARPLASFLKHGQYHGMDIVSTSIDWCNKTYAQHAPNFKFHYLDAYNSMYNPTGKHLSSEYRFPFEDNTFDFIFLTSVFTHMLPADMENYTREISRLLKTGGRCLITYFINNDDSLRRIKAGTTRPEFRYELGECLIDNQSVPEAAICYKEDYIRQLYQSCGLKISDPIKFGAWSGRPDFLSFQDIIIAHKS